MSETVSLQPATHRRHTAMELEPIPFILGEPVIPPRPVTEEVRQAFAVAAFEKLEWDWAYEVNSVPVRVLEEDCRQTNHITVGGADVAMPVRMHWSEEQAMQNLAWLGKRGKQR